VKICVISGQKKEGNMNIGITGQSGFIGTHLYNYLNLQEDTVTIPFKDEYFQDQEIFDDFVSKCDVIVHLAAMNRHGEEGVIYKTNVELVEKLISSLERTKSNAHVLISSSTQENRDNEYGRSKKKARELLVDWAHRNNGKFTGLVIPNVFGPFGKPFYNSFIATFSHLLCTGGEPKVEFDAEVPLIYVQDLVQKILDIIRKKEYKNEYRISHIATAKVTDVLKQLISFYASYVKKGIFPKLDSYFKLIVIRNWIQFQQLLAIELNADIVFKGTKVDGVYTADPQKDKTAKLLSKMAFVKRNSKIKLSSNAQLL
jgi:UDP-2-acetamido-2,6-beta-L-arabino-hexul-4-ose reductase